MINKLKNKWTSIPLTVKVSTAYAVCSILQKCLSFITLPLFTRLLTTDQYGQFTIYQSWYGIICIFITLNLAYGSFSTAMVKFEDRRPEYISSIQGICLLLSGLFLLIYLPFRGLWNRLFELPTLFILLMVAEIICSTATSLWSGKKRFEFKYKSVVLVTLLSAILSPLLAFILVKTNAEKGLARIAGYSLVAIGIGGFLFVLNLIRGKKLFTKEFWKYAFGFNIPLLAYYLSQVIFNQSDRIMISKLAEDGISKAAMYGVAYNLAMILTFVLNAINNSYVPWMYGKIKEHKNEENKNVSLGIGVLLALMILCVIWFAPEIITIMAGEKYRAAIMVVPPVAMSLFLLFYSQLFINVEFFYEEKKSLVWASVGAAAVNILLNWLLIPCFGFVAAGYTTLFSYFIFAGANLIAMKRMLKKKGLPDSLYNYKLLFLLLLVFLISGFLGMLFYPLLPVRIAITAIVFLLALIFSKKLLGILALIKKKS